MIRNASGITGADWSETAHYKIWLIPPDFFLWSISDLLLPILMPTWAELIHFMPVNLSHSISSEIAFCFSHIARGRKDKSLSLLSAKQNAGVSLFDSINTLCLLGTDLCLSSIKFSPLPVVTGSAFISLSFSELNYHPDPQVRPGSQCL